MTHDASKEMRLPEWNDLSNDQRMAVVAVADYNLGGTDADCYAGQTAMEIYQHIRSNIMVALPPIIAPFHEAPTPSEAGET